MKRETLTAAELAKKVKVGDKLILEVEVCGIDLGDERPIKLLNTWLSDSKKLTTLTPEPEAQPEARVTQVGDVYECIMEGSNFKGGQYLLKSKTVECIAGKEIGETWPSYNFDFFDTKRWKFLYNIHDKTEQAAKEVIENVVQAVKEDDTYPDGMEWRTIAECKLVEDDEIEVLDTRLNKNEIVKLKIINVNEKEVLFDDDSVCKLSNANKIFRIYRRATPEWQPKEGETVWVRFMGESFIFSKYCDNGCKAPALYARLHKIDNDKQIFYSPLSELEPYTGQDLPTIDFSKAGQWIQCKGCIFKTTGHLYDENEFFGIALGVTWTQKCDATQNWQPCTPEQIELINNLLKTLK